jgi:branched-chain amino acid transport system substrate-binding protein
MIRQFLFVLIVGTLCTAASFVYDYFTSYDYSFAKRQELAKTATDDIKIAVILKKDAPESFRKGIEVALAEENKQGFVFTRDKKQITRKLAIRYVKEVDKISSVVNDHETIAVLGFVGSVAAVEASISYENYGILFLSAIATDERLTNHGLKYTFSIIPVDKDYAKQLVEFAASKQYRRVSYLYSRQGTYGLNLSNNFSSFLLGKDIKIIGSYSFDPAKHDQRELIYEMLQNKPDAVLLGAIGDVAARMIYQLRTLGITEPILGSDGLDNPKIWATSGEKASNTYVASVYLDNPYTKNRNTYTEFHDTFLQQNGEPPDYLARQGYESVKILAAAIRKGDSTVPITIAATLKYGIGELFGGYKFDGFGRIMNKEIIMKVMNKGAFYDVSANGS